MFTTYTTLSTLGLNFNAMNLGGNEPKRLVDLELTVRLRLLGGGKAACPGPSTRSSCPESWGGAVGIRPRGLEVGPHMVSHNSGICRDLSATQALLWPQWGNPRGTWLGSRGHSPLLTLLRRLN